MRYAGFPKNKIVPSSIEIGIPLVFFFYNFFIFVHVFSIRVVVMKMQDNPAKAEKHQVSRGRGEFVRDLGPHLTRFLHTMHLD